MKSNWSLHFNNGYSITLNSKSLPSIAIIAKVGGYTLLCPPFLGKYKPAMLLLGMAF